MNEPRLLVDRGGLDGRDLVPAETFADDIKPTRQRRVAKGLVAFARESGERMVAVSDFSGLASSVCALASAPAIAPIVSLERCMTGLRLEQIEADGAGFRALGANAMAGRLLGIFRHQLFQL